MAEVSLSSVQIISGNGSFNAAVLDRFVRATKLPNYGLAYKSVAVIGPQSSGKSTLLNHLFGTKFKEMDASEGRGQTTRGIWIGKCAGIVPFTIAMDIEGTDGSERGEDDTAFEKQSALFALATANIVAELREQIVNLISPRGLAGDGRGVIPASGFSFSAQQIWKSIKENKDLDLPAHKVMVATVRCEGIANEKLRQLFADENWLALEAAVQEGPVQGFGQRLNAILYPYLSEYDKETVCFDENVRTAKREYLLSKAFEEAYKRVPNRSTPPPPPPPAPAPAPATFWSIAPAVASAAVSAAGLFVNFSC